MKRESDKWIVIALLWLRHSLECGALRLQLSLQTQAPKGDLTHSAWDALGHTATQLLAAGQAASYVGPLCALLGYAIKQWSTFKTVPKEAKAMLRRCYDLLFDLQQAWQNITAR